MEHEIALRIVVVKPPPDVDFGLQKGKGAHYEPVQVQTSGAKDLVFEFTVGIKPRGESTMPIFLGAFVQGPPEGRFVYLDIGTSAGQIDSAWSRRLKIPLSGITWTMIDQLSADPHLILETRVPGTGKDGGPTCGTVKPFDGWKLGRLTSRSSLELKVSG